MHSFKSMQQSSSIYFINLNNVDTTSMFYCFAIFDVFSMSKIASRSLSYQTLFLRKHIIFPFFAVKLCHFIVNTTFFICYKHSSLTAKIGKWRKTNFGRIDSWCMAELLFSIKRKVSVILCETFYEFVLNFEFDFTARTLACHRFVINVIVTL